MFSCFHVFIIVVITIIVVVMVVVAVVVAVVVVIVVLIIVDIFVEEIFSIVANVIIYFYFITPDRNVTSLYKLATMNYLCYIRSLQA